MTDDQFEIELINQSAARHNVPADALEKLLALEASFENFSVFGSKADFTRQVARILDEALSPHDA
jgi:hypothetical protein